VTFPVEAIVTIADVTITIELWTVLGGEPGAAVPGMSKAGTFSPSPPEARAT